MKGTLSIQIYFGGEAVDLPRDFEHRLVKLVDEVCRAHMAAHPELVMWPSGTGKKITYMPMTQAEEQAGLHITFDESVFSIDCCARPRFDDEEPFYRGDYDWREATLAIVGWGGWGRKGDWWTT